MLKETFLTKQYHLNLEPNFPQKRLWSGKFLDNRAMRTPNHKE